jgi:hypothetical protein
MKKAMIYSAIFAMLFWAGIVYLPGILYPIEPDESQKAYDKAMMLPFLEIAANQAEKARLDAESKDATVADGVEYEKALDELEAAEKAAKDADISGSRITQAIDRGKQKGADEWKWLRNPSGPAPR